MKTGLFAHFRTRIVRGLLAIMPLLITVWLLRALFNLVNDNVTPWVETVFEAIGTPDLDRWQSKIGFPIIGVLLTVIIIYLVGLLAGHLASRRLFIMVERFILRIPLVKSVYGSARQLLNSFSSTGKRKFSKVVLVEYPRRGLWTVGFVTCEEVHRLPAADGTAQSPSVPVFLPTTPNPTSGWMAMVPSDSLVVLDITIEEGLKFIVSGGIVSPGDLSDLIKSEG
jgi:uncharacterized membrane protein